MGSMAEPKLFSDIHLGSTSFAPLPSPGIIWLHFMTLSAIASAHRLLVVFLFRFARGPVSLLVQIFSTAGPVSTYFYCKRNFWLLLISTNLNRMSRLMGYHFHFIFSKVPGSNLGSKTCYPDWDISWLSSVFLGEWRSSTLNYATTDMFHVRSISSYTYHPFIRRWIV
jgi:hypothetical protein